MSDLISRSQLLKEIETWGGCVDALHDYIQNMPTAYSVNKVVDELEELKNKDICDYLDCDVCLYYKKCGVETDQSNNLKWDKAIEIVKQCGVSDDVCEWQRDEHSENDNPAEWIICPHKPKRIFSKDIKYCPYCRKKIKVVE